MKKLIIPACVISALLMLLWVGYGGVARFYPDWAIQHYLMMDHSIEAAIESEGHHQRARFETIVQRFGTDAVPSIVLWLQRADEAQRSKYTELLSYYQNGYGEHADLVAGVILEYVCTGVSDAWFKSNYEAYMSLTTSAHYCNGAFVDRAIERAALDKSNSVTLVLFLVDSNVDQFDESQIEKLLEFTYKNDPNLVIYTLGLIMTENSSNPFVVKRVRELCNSENEGIAEYARETLNDHGIAIE